MGALFAYSLLSAVNGLVVRIALLCSNVFVVPMIWFIGVFTGQPLSARNRALIYHSMGLLGAQMAHLERTGRSKWPLGLAVSACLFVIYFIQSGVFFFWTRVFLPNNTTMHLNDTYFIYMNSVEFCFFIFVRTRLSLKYVAKLITCANVIFLAYINSYMYAATF